jgi:hypothetical protein
VRPYGEKRSIIRAGISNKKLLHLMENPEELSIAAISDLLFACGYRVMGLKIRKI